MRALTAGRSCVTQKINIFCLRIENTLGKGENAGDQHFILFKGINSFPHNSDF